MANVTQLLAQIEEGQSSASEQLLPLVYEELRRLAASRMAKECPGQTLQATALVHEAFLRLVDGDRATNWNSRGHFFAAAAEAMRRILVESARRKARHKHGGKVQRYELHDEALILSAPPDEFLAVHEALDLLDATNTEAARLVKLRYFAGFTINEAAECMDISPRKANQIWAYARAWLATEIGSEPSVSDSPDAPDGR